MNKTITSTLVFVLAFSLINSAAAKPGKVNQYAPESESAAEDGLYDVGERPDLKVKVFVHKEKSSGKAGQALPALICSADNDSAAVIGDAGWQLPANVTFRLNQTSVPSSVGNANLVQIVDNSFATWTNAIVGKVTLTRGANTSVSRSRFDGQNVITWGRTSGNTLGVTYVWYYTASGVVAEVDTIMNNRVAWKWNGGNSNCADSTAYDAQNIMVHELGHWFGLDDEYDAAYVNNTMYGYGSKGEVKKITATSGDISGLQAIYP